jgi:hypothetical protein
MLSPTTLATAIIEIAAAGASSSRIASANDHDAVSSPPSLRRSHLSGRASPTTRSTLKITTAAGLAPGTPAIRRAGTWRR